MCTGDQNIGVPYTEFKNRGARSCSHLIARRHSVIHPCLIETSARLEIPSKEPHGGYVIANTKRKYKRAEFGSINRIVKYSHSEYESSRREKTSDNLYHLMFGWSQSPGFHACMGRRITTYYTIAGRYKACSAEVFAY